VVEEKEHIALSLTGSPIIIAHHRLSQNIAYGFPVE
jgi:hypothetical protein